MDVKKDADSNFVFATKGGQTACPYEGADSTKYYQKGTVLNQPTVQIEVPVLTINAPVASNVPESRPAVYDLVLSNNSEANLSVDLTLTYQDVDSIKGATISIDGTAIGGSGRLITIPAGTTITKVLTLTKGPNAYDYNNIPIILKSQCDYTVADTQYISAHFIPSCSDIALAAPLDKWVLNTRSDVDANGTRYLPVTINKFDVNNKYFDHIELQYKQSSQSIWSTLMNFYYDESAFSKAQEPKQLITNPSAINYNFKMDDGSFNDQTYDLQAVSACLLGPGNIVTTSSNIAGGIKDTYNPRLFGNPQPSDGILSLGEDIGLTFNEPIEGGLLTHSKFQVTGIRNGSKSDNSVSVKLDGINDYLNTEFPKNLTAKNISAEAWILPYASENGTVFSQGIQTNSMELAITADNHLEIIIGTKKIASDDAVVQPGLWSHVALVYNDSTKKVSAFYNYKQVINDVSVNAYNGTGIFEFGRSISKQGNYFKGNMHEARVWTKVLSFVDLQLNSHIILSGSENALIAYYPMDEGKGTIVYDKARGSNAVLTGNWSTPAGKAISFGGNGYLRMNTAYTPINSAMDYTIELWFKGAVGQKDAALAASGRGDGTDGAGSLNTFFLGFENGLLTYRNNGSIAQADGNYLDNNWHNVAIAVTHVSGTAQLYVDGIMKTNFDANKLGGLEAPASYTYLGARPWQSKDSITITNFDRYFKGNVDEFRIWTTYLNQTIINKDDNIRLNGDELGLMVYYPFEKYYKSNLGIIEMDSTLFDQAINDQTTGVSIYAEGGKNKISADMAPVKDRGPVADLSFDYVVNNDALIINMTEPKQSIDKTVVTFKVKDVLDKNGNYLLSPITWTAYIDQDALQWSDDEFNLAKDINAPLQFESYIINKSGTAQNFRLDKLPKWLTADVISGTIEPAGKQKIMFTVNEHTNTGTYNELVYLYNDYSETATLGVNLIVKGKQPDWSVDPGAYKYNMAVYGKIRINDIFSINTGDMLAAFINGKCVGVTNNTYNSATDLWYAFLTVYSDSIKYNDLEFRIWEASTGKIYQAVPTQEINFTNDAIAGSANSPVIFDGKEMQYQDIALNKGWNWISFNVKNSNFNNINTALSNGQWNSGDIVKNNDAGFDQYSTTSGWLGYLPGFNNTAMYMLSTDNAQTLSMLGNPVNLSNTSIPIKGGRWNYISYLPGINLSVKQSLSGYNATDGDVIKSQTGFAMYSEQNGWIGSLTYLEPGKGYMLYRQTTKDTSFYYPVNVDPLDGLRITNGGSVDSAVTANRLYSSNMTMIAVLDDAYKLQPGDIIIAYSMNEERSKAKIMMNSVTNKQALFFNIAGQNNEPVYFKLQRNGRIIAESDKTLSYISDSRIGMLNNPYVIHMKLNNVLISAYPNPFQSNVTITVDLPASEVTSTHEVYVSIYNTAGKMVTNMGKQIMYNGHYQTLWNGRTGNGQGCAAGVYFINLMIDDKLNTYKIIKIQP